MGNASTGGNAYIPVGGGGGGAVISAGTNSQNTGTVVFSNSNGVSFGLNTNGVITATVVPGAAAGIAAIQASNTTYTSGTVVFSNSNGISFGSTAGGGITASYTVPAATVFSNSNNVSFGLAGSTITATATVPIGIGAAAAGTQTQTSGSLVFSNSNGVTFGMSNSSVVTASYTVPGATVFSNSNNVSFGLAGSTVTATATVQIGIGAAAAGSQTQTSGSLLFSNSNGVTFGMSNSSVVTASYTVPGATVFSNSNNVSFGLAGSTVTATATFAGGAGGVALSAAGSSQSGGTVVFSNSNGLSFGMNGSTVTGSYTQAAQTNQSLGVYGLSQTTGQSSSSTYDARSLSFAGYGIISIGQSGGSIQISAPGTTSFAAFSAGLTNSGNTSGNTGLVQNQLVFVGTNGITLSGSTNASSMTITISGNTAGAGGAAISAGTQSTGGGTVVFSNSNNVTFGMSNSSVVTASFSATQISSVGMYALGNTTQNSSTTLDQRTLSFNALGAMTMGYSNGSIQVSAPATSSISGTGLVSVAVNGSTISIGAANKQLSFFQPLPMQSTLATQYGIGSVQVYAAPNAFPFSASRADIFATLSCSALALSTEAQTLSLFIGLYSLNGSTLSLASSGSQSYAWTNSSNNSNASISGMRRFSAPFNANYTGGFDLFVGVMSNTTFVNTNGVSISNVVVPVGPGQQLQGLIGQVPANSMQFVPGQGIFSTTSAAMPVSMALSAISGVGSGGNLVDNYSPVLFANVTA